MNTTPTIANDSQSASRPAAYQQLAAVGCTILVVEDEAFVREATCDILEGEGYLVLRARDAMEARAAFRRQHGSVQLLLCDVVLPGQSGPTLANDLRTLRPALRIMFISGYDNTPSQDGLATAHTSYLPKPFSAESLLKKVRQALGLEEKGSP
ncbi:MAG TPA: response regulator [Terriglobales bacterium]|nr:response regulator [Terriglobales bacterium]